MILASVFHCGNEIVYHVAKRHTSQENNITYTLRKSIHMSTQRGGTTKLPNFNETEQENKIYLY